jgi:hypothetical protein
VSIPKLHLEIISGPLDGEPITLEAAVEWGRTGEGALSFPWDEELAAPQAKVYVEEGKWWLAHVSGERSTRHNMDRIEERVVLAKGDVIKAANTWLLVTGLETIEEV